MQLQTTGDGRPWFPFPPLLAACRGTSGYVFFRNPGFSKAAVYLFQLMQLLKQHPQGVNDIFSSAMLTDLSDVEAVR